MTQDATVKLEVKGKPPYRYTGWTINNRSIFISEITWRKPRLDREDCLLHRLRSQWGQAASVGEKIEQANAMSGALSRLLLVAENYPQLKSNENFLALQSQLEGTENRIAVERMRYNQGVQLFNQFRRSFFGRFFTNAAGVTEPAIYFEAEEAAKTTVPEVQF